MAARDHARLWQRLFLFLLFVCTAQASYWVVEQIDHARYLRDTELARFSSLSTLEQDLTADPSLLAQAVERYLAESAGAVAGGPKTDEDPVFAIHDEYESRRTRLLWEGSFFLLVLFGAMGVISRALRESRLLVESQQNFITSISHELRTPLASLKLSADTLSLRAPDKEHSARLATRMLEDVNRLSEMVSQVLQSARLDSTVLTEDPIPTALSPLLEAEVSRLHGLLEARGVRFHLEVPGDHYLLARPAELKTVLGNLLSNAGKSCVAAGGGAVRVVAAREGERVKLSITDEGVGFDPQESERIFERFYRPGDELRRETPGYGLGLFLVQELTRNHGGQVRAASDGPGQGACLTLWWPAAPTPALP